MLLRQGLYLPLSISFSATATIHSSSRSASGLSAQFRNREHCSSNVEWAKNVRVGYLDQHSTLTAGMTIESVLKSAFSWLFALEEKMQNEIRYQLSKELLTRMLFRNLITEEEYNQMNSLNLQTFQPAEAKLYEKNSRCVTEK